MTTKLKQYLDERPGSKLKLAEELGKGPSFVTKIMDGTLRMTPDRAVDISKALGGEVAIIDLLYPDGIPAGAKLLPDGQLDLPLTVQVGDVSPPVGDEPVKTEDK